MNEGTQRLVNEIEALLVQEFRLAEALYQAALNDRAARVNGAGLPGELSAWHAMLAERARLTHRQILVSQELLREQRSGRRGRRKGQERAWGAALASLEPETALRFHRLREGSQILFERAHEIAQGSQQLESEVTSGARDLHLSQGASL